MKKIILSGVQPSGNLHLGNYLGAIKNWVELQKKYQCFFCIVDLHAITVPQAPEVLRAKTIEVAKIYLACGIDPELSTIFIQSQVSAHAELGWILGTITKVGEMERMTQYKDKSLKQKEGIGLGLMSYPSLMAADILLYSADLVPVGDDQTQHLEFTRTVARRFNTRFGHTFEIPDQYTSKVGARIMALDDPSKKMSKSAENPLSYVALTDSPELIREKFKRAVTDSGKEIKYTPTKPAIMNLMDIYSLLSGIPSSAIESKYAGKGYAEFKKDLAEIVVSFLSPVQKNLKSLTDEKTIKILLAGAQKAKKLATKKLTEVKEKIGLVS